MFWIAGPGPRRAQSGREKGIKGRPGDSVQNKLKFRLNLNESSLFGSCAKPNQEAEYQMKILCKKLIKNV